MEAADVLEEACEDEVCFLRNIVIQAWHYVAG
jgi:hypothetical protein